MNAIVFAKGCEVRASSRDVAVAFEKEHRTVLRSIDALIAQEPSLTPAQFCAGVSTMEGTGRQEHRFYEMNRDGFSLLAMGFTGPKALKWKLAFIDAFNQMELQLRAAAEDEGDRLELPSAPDEFERTRLKLQMVREARIAFGPAAARRMWVMAELPDLSEPFVPPDHLPMVQSDVYRSIAIWMRERLEHSASYRCRSQTLWNDYVRWCRAGGEFEPLGLIAFGKFLTACGIGKIMSDGAYRTGVRLRPG